MIITVYYARSPRAEIQMHECTSLNAAAAFVRRIERMGGEGRGFYLGDAFTREVKEQVADGDSTTDRKS